LEREGVRHTIYTNPVNGAKTSVPRHTEIDNRLARKICQQLGIAPVR
jgi:mRNA interferase HicA